MFYFCIIVCVFSVNEIFLQSDCLIYKIRRSTYHMHGERTCWSVVLNASTSYDHANFQANIS